ncbi:uncharacterized protein LOC119682716 [Teleopsis dalmanni]|uniref:uncharacterized protein LOC119682716 n=1 Tax=Teleopsis dalmanni TaxID=139649 RepID=UPI000D32CFF3|nr:uncharacterized protein LOC119682716 [Teleopsis dalmanni]
MESTVNDPLAKINKNLNKEQKFLKKNEKVFDLDAYPQPIKVCSDELTSGTDVAESILSENLLQNLYDMKSNLKYMDEQMNRIENRFCEFGKSDIKQIPTIDGKKGKKESNETKQPHENNHHLKASDITLNSSQFLEKSRLNEHILGNFQFCDNFNNTSSGIPTQHNFLPHAEELANKSQEKAQSYESFTRLNCGISATHYWSPFVKKTAVDKSAPRQKLRVPEHWRQNLHRKLRPSLCDADNEK